MRATSLAVDLSDEKQLAPLRPYRLLVEEAALAVRTLAGISVKRPDLFGILNDLSRSGAMFVCDLDLAATERADQNVLRYHPSRRLMVILAAYVADDDWNKADRLVIPERLTCHWLRSLSGVATAE